jgi:hypothetical protein
MTTICLGFFLLAMAVSALLLFAVDRRALRPVLTTTALVIALGGYAAAVFH